MAEPGTKHDPIRLHEAQDAERRIVIHPKDDDLFVRTGRQVIESCRLRISVDLWLNELTGMIEAVQEWAAGHADRVAACYCAAGGSKTVLFFVPASERFDFDLADALTELNGRLVREFNVGMVEVRQIPATEIERFVDPESARLVYGRPKDPDPKSRRAVET